MGSALRDDGFTDDGSACDAGLPFASVHAVAVLEFALASFCVYVIGHGGATKFDGFFKYLAYGCQQRIHALAADPIGSARRPDAGTEESFVGVDVADAS